MQQLMFYIFSSLILISACCVVCLTNCVYSVFSLIFCFLCTACLWLFLNAEFFAIVLVLVYVGAVLVLFLFVVMLVDVQENITYDFFLKFLYMFLLFVLFFLILYYFFNINYFSYLKINEYLKIMFYEYDPRIEVLGVFLCVSRLFEFILIGILFLVGIIITITLILKDNQNIKKQSVFKD